MAWHDICFVYSTSVIEDEATNLSLVMSVYAFINTVCLAAISRQVEKRKEYKEAALKCSEIPSKTESCSVFGLCPAALWEDQPAHLNAVTSLDNYLLYTPLGSITGCLDLVLGSLLGKVQSKWFIHFCSHTQLCKVIFVKFKVRSACLKGPKDFLYKVFMILMQVFFSL